MNIWYRIFVTDTKSDEMKQNQILPGPVLLFGSGETSPSGRKLFEYVLRDLPPGPRMALLETPAGFELNSSQVIGRVGEFLRLRLQNYQPQIEIIPARARGTFFSPDNPEILNPMLEADLIFMGPGSPSYAVRQLEASLAWQMLLARHRLGATLALASAATIAISTFALPVYEIYKVGEDLHWKPGLNFFGLYGLPLVFVPHWNNNDGGAELDTSRCFMGQARFEKLMKMLPPDLTVIGLDEKTGLIMDIHKGQAHVIGIGGVTLIHTGHAHTSIPSRPELQDVEAIALEREGHVHHYKNGQTFPLSECCPFTIPELEMGVDSAIWEQALETYNRVANESQKVIRVQPPEKVMRLVNERQAARLSKEWAEADRLRLQIADLGWQVNDSPDGPVVVKI